MAVKRNRRLKRRLRISLLLLSLPLGWLGLWHLQGHFERPQLALVLGGSVEREKFATEFARQHPTVEVWISSGAPASYTHQLLAQAQVPATQVRLDYQASDTVTNFTTLVDDLDQKGIKSIYLITSDYHMRRAKIVAEVVLGSRGIHFKPIAIPSNQTSETLIRGLRDGARAVLWLLTGNTGAEFAQIAKKMPLGRQN